METHNYFTKCIQLLCHNAYILLVTLVKMIPRYYMNNAESNLQPHTGVLRVAKGLKRDIFQTELYRTELLLHNITLVQAVHKGRNKALFIDGNYGNHSVIHSMTYV